MKKALFLLTVFSMLSCWCVLSAQSPEVSIHTYYEKGVFYTQCKVPINASEKVLTSVLDDFVNQYKNDLDKLFAWGLKGLKLQGEKDALISYNLKPGSYNEDTGIIIVKMDAIVPGVLTVRDITIEGKMEKEPCV